MLMELKLMNAKCKKLKLHFPVNVMKTYRAEVRLHPFLNSVIDGTGVNLTPRVLYTRESTPVGPRAGLDVSEKRKISCPHQDSNSRPSIT